MNDLISELPDSIPEHIAIIMDGNGRWAKAKGLPRLAGHKAGTENVRRIVKACVDFGVKYLTIYAFSTENWGRPEDEVNGLMNIFDQVFNRELKELHRQGAQLRHLGRLDQIKKSLRDKVVAGIEQTKDNDKLVFNVAFNYGGRDEIVRAIKGIVSDGIPIEKINEALISTYLYTHDSPDPDLVIRTSGEQRISNFLIWQAAYAEWIFPDTYWPDFGPEQLLIAIQEFAKRERRFGGVLQN